MRTGCSALREHHKREEVAVDIGVPEAVCGGIEKKEVRAGECTRERQDSTELIDS